MRSRQWQASYLKHWIAQKVIGGVVHFSVQFQCLPSNRNEALREPRAARNTMYQVVHCCMRKVMSRRKKLERITNLELMIALAEQGGVDHEIRFRFKSGPGHFFA